MRKTLGRGLEGAKTRGGLLVFFLEEVAEETWAAPVKDFAMTYVAGLELDTRGTPVGKDTAQDALSICSWQRNYVHVVVAIYGSLHH